jgi:hypothetical protein
MTRSLARGPSTLKPWALGLSVVVCGVLGCSHGAPEGQPGASSVPASGGDPVAAFQTVKAVLQDPRCQNCHPAIDAPLQGDESRVHDQNIQRGTTGHGAAGAECTTCHGVANLPPSYGTNVPPGVATGWHMPPPDQKMVFVGMSSRELCEGLKDTTRNGGKDFPALVKHVSSDPLVLWGWAPGTGRKPVQISHDRFVAEFKTWAGAGGPCPR